MAGMSLRPAGSDGAVVAGRFTILASAGLVTGAALAISRLTSRISLPGAVTSERSNGVLLLRTYHVARRERDTSAATPAAMPEMIRRRECFTGIGGILSHTSAGGRTSRFFRPLRNTMSIFGSLSNMYHSLCDTRKYHHLLLKNLPCT